MVKNQLTLPSDLVKKSNDLIRTKVSFGSVDGGRILAALVASIHADDRDLAGSYSVEVSRFLPDDSGRGYRRYKALCQEMAQSYAELEAMENGEITYEARPIFMRIKYQRGKITARFNTLLASYLLNLRGCFTQYGLMEYLLLPSVYSQRLFEILQSWKNAKDGEVILPLPDLHRWLDTPPSFQKNFKEFRRWVLEKAHKDITEKTNFSYEWEPVKAGRSVEKIRFIFGPRKQALAEAEKQKALEDKRRRLKNQRFFAAVRCAQNKNGDCRAQDNKRLICKLCRETRILEDIRKKPD